MIKIGWIIDAEMFGGYRDELVACIRESGHDAHLVQPPHPPYRWEDLGSPYRRQFPKGSCVIAHGDIEFVTRIARERWWVPGAFGTVDNFACSNYYCWFGKFLLNQDYVMLPFGELSRRRDFLFRTPGVDGRVFIRPDSPLKLFTGQVAARNSFDADLEFMGFYEFPINSLVVVSAPKCILAEWRFVAVSGKIVAGCQYKLNGKMELDPSYHPAAYNLASTIAASEYQPDPAWVLDICKTDDGKFHLLEIGGFSFSDLYACDKRAIVEAVSEAAAREWERTTPQSTGPSVSL
ncbi:MAG: ATP-grasp domain-containing protein [Planctomycetes bacterium]|nr:ATP-grasp domain-containing protein [Planctomycetota bacterium]